MFQKTDSIHIYLLMVYIDFYVKFSEWGPNYLVIAARSIDCLENNVALRYLQNWKKVTILAIQEATFLKAAKHTHNMPML